MREIKFRVWDTEHEEWCGADVQLLRGDGDFVTAMFGKDGILEDPIVHSIRPDGTRRFDVQLFTGLKDKNGKEIYEGDIVREDQQLRVVEYQQATFMPFYSDITSYGGWDNEECEVIGNIYENPELLEGPK